MKVFISYSSKDTRLRKEISECLKDLGHSVWADKSLKSGQEWWQEILREIRKADVVISLISRNYNESEACDLELAYAHDLSKQLLPIKIANISNQLLPISLSRLQILDYKSLSVTKRITGLVNALSATTNSSDFPRANPSPLPEEPEMPVSYKTRIYNILEQDTELDIATQKEIIDELKRNVLNNKGDHHEIKLLLEKMLQRGDEIRMSIYSEAKDLLKKTSSEGQPKAKASAKVEIEAEKAEASLPNQTYQPQPQPVMTTPTPDQQIPSQDTEKLHMGLQITSFLLPLVGIITFFVYKKENPTKSKRALILAGIGFVAGWIITALNQGAYYY